MTKMRAPLHHASILGVRVDDVDMDDAVGVIGEFIERGRADGTTHQVTTVNVDFVVNAVRDPSLMGLLSRAELSIPDGMPIVWGARLSGTPLRARVSGADLVPELAREAARRGWRLYLFGSAPGVAERAAEHLCALAEGLQVRADSGGSFARVAETPADARRLIREARPDILLVALGNPKQEWWIEQFRGELGVPVCIGVGGTFDLLIGNKRRAPRWMQRLGLEWIFRALQEPRRLARRYGTDLLVFVPRMSVQIVRARWSRRSIRRSSPGSPR